MTSVTLTEHAAAGGLKLAEAQLNVPETLNALSLEMIDALAPALERWREDDAVAAVLITGAGDRAFCAGGDIQALYRAITANHAAGEVVDDYPFAFFEREYRLDYTIHNYPKPVIALGHGIVMGGGLGIFAGARYRVVTERSRIAMPEVTIGLFPDAGGTWLLRNMPAGAAAFIGLTGASVNAADALSGGIGTHHVAGEQRGEVLQRLLGIDLTDEAAIAEMLASLPPADLPAGEFGALPEAIDLYGDYADVADRVAGLAGASEWIDRGVDAMRKGCPTTVGIVIEQLRRAPLLDMADCFRLEMCVGTHCATFSEFAEGVRALIIEKDNAPQWRFASVADIDPAHVLAHFDPPWEDNPLQDLG